MTVFVSDFANAPTQAPERVSLSMALDIGMCRFGLTPREKEVMRHLLANPDAQYIEIADAMYISRESIRNHLNAVHHKTDCRSTQGSLLTLLKSGMGEAS